MQPAKCATCQPAFCFLTEKECNSQTLVKNTGLFQLAQNLSLVPFPTLAEKRRQHTQFGLKSEDTSFHGGCKFNLDRLVILVFKTTLCLKQIGRSTWVLQENEPHGLARSRQRELNCWKIRGKLILKAQVVNMHVQHLIRDFGSARITFQWI